MYSPISLQALRDDRKVLQQLRIGGTLISFDRLPIILQITFVILWSTVRGKNLYNIMQQVLTYDKQSLLFRSRVKLKFLVLNSSKLHLYFVEHRTSQALSSS